MQKSHKSGLILTLEFIQKCSNPPKSDFLLKKCHEWEAVQFRTEKNGYIEQLSMGPTVPLVAFPVQTEFTEFFVSSNPLNLWLLYVTIAGIQQFKYRIIPIKRPGHWVIFGGRLLRCWKTVQKIATYCKITQYVCLGV